MYIEGGSYFETNVPLGNFELRYAAGDIWYGQNHLFGPETVTVKANKLFEFSIEDNQYSGYTLELIKQIGGNLSVSKIPIEKF